MTKRRPEIGFWDTPDKFEAAVASLDASIQKLAQAVDAAPDAGGINATWRGEFRKFVRRWELERDQYAPWSARLLLSIPNMRLQMYKDTYLWWAADFEKKAKRKIGSKPAAEPETLSASLVPGGALMVGALLVLFVVMKGSK